MIDVIVPVHNEGASIGGTLREFYSTVAIDSKIPIRFVVCEDGSTDNTVAVLKSLAEELPLKLISDPMRKGYSRSERFCKPSKHARWNGFGGFRVIDVVARVFAVNVGLALLALTTASGLTSARHNVSQKP